MMINKRTKHAFYVATFLLAVGVAPSCSNLESTNEVKKNPPPSIKKITVTPFFGDESVAIANMITTLSDDFEESDRDTLASQILEASEKYNIDPRLLIAIINTESNFNQDKVSPTGDVSIAQVNVETWNKEYKRMKKRPINKQRIKTDQAYALMTMAEILSILKKRYEKTDATWYARYHSNNQKHKNEYLLKITKGLRLIASTPILISNKLAVLR